MNTPDSTNGNAPQTASGQQAAQRAKKPYQKPAFRFERVFETMALTCGKVNTTQPQCHFNRKLS